jgi:hypothetical protein
MKMTWPNKMPQSRMLQERSKFIKTRKSAMLTNSGPAMIWKWVIRSLDNSDQAIGLLQTRLSKIMIKASDQAIDRIVPTRLLKRLR